MRTFDIGLLIAWVVVPPLLLLFLHGNFFISSLLHLVIPSLYFSLKRPRIVPKALVVSFATIPFLIALDYMAFLNGAWAVPTVFALRFFQFIPVEDFVFTFCATYVVIAGFDYFFPGLQGAIINMAQLKRSSAIVSGLFVLFLGLYLFDSAALRVNYYDAWLLILAFIIPTFILSVWYPPYRSALVWLICYSFVLMLPYELTADKLGFWTFPGEYLGMLHILGQRFPVEEFLEWMLFFPPAALAFSIFITGNSKNRPANFSA